ncbi:MAG TPA: diguanylate cyclase [Acidiferrobacteraceae bacterium]|nr:diguanylate cyclase [Acidiferrobacteraceae bacterium]
MKTLLLDSEKSFVPAGIVRGAVFGVRQKVLTVLVATLLLTLSVNNYLSLADQKRQMEASIAERGASLSALIADNAAYGVAAYDYHTLALLAAKLVGHDHIVYLGIVNDRGHTMAAAGHLGGPVQQFTAPIALGGRTLGRLTLGLSTASLHRTLIRNRDAFLRRQAIAIVLIAMIELSALSLIVLRPLRAISVALGRESGTPTADIPVRGSDEFGQLAQQFNLLRTQLTSRIDLANREVREANRRLEIQAQELKKVNEELKRMSVTDALTGLHNRRYFESQLEVEVELSLRTGDPTSLVLADLDRFKEVNDRLGHAVGDDLLKHVASILGHRLRRTDTAGRFGGDEFYILARRSSRLQAEALVRSLREQLKAQPFRSGNEIVPIVASFGIATLPGSRQARSARQFFRQADEALYAAKAAGRDGVLHFDALETTV